MPGADLPPLPGPAVAEEALREWGRGLGATLTVPAIIALRGPLGAGKTTLAQAILAGAGVTDVVTSPTFSLVQTYDSPRGPVAHLDLYRLRSPAEFEALGWDDLLQASALVLVEWPERADSARLGARLEITLDDLPDDADRRRVEVRWLT